MAANQYGIDMADIYRTTEAVKGSRIRNEGARTENKLAGMTLTPEAQSLKQDVIGGNEEAGRKLAALDPRNGQKFVDAIAGMDTRKREAVARNVDEIGRASMFVLAGSSPEQQAQRYATMRENLSPEAAAGLPEVYDPQFMELSLAKATTMQQLLQNPTVVSSGGDDVTYQRGREIDRRKKPVKNMASGGSGKGGGGNWKGPTSINSIRRLATDLAGGLFDERTGSITKLQTGTRSDMQAVISEASRLLQNNEARNEAEAVTMAAQKLDVPYEIPNLSGNNQAAQDPLGIR